MTTLEKYKIIVKLCGISYNNYPGIGGIYIKLINKDLSKRNVTNEHLTKDNLILANKAWKTIIDLYYSLDLSKAYVAKAKGNNNNISVATELIEEILNSRKQDEHRI